MRLQFNTLAALFVMIYVGQLTHGADLIYVAMPSGIMTYDTSLPDATAVQNSAQVFATGNQPRGITLDSAGNVYVANYGNATMSKFNSVGTPLFDINTNLDKPSNVAVDSAGNIYVTNRDIATISKFDSTGAYLSTISGNGMNTLTGIAIDTADKLYVSNTNINKVMKLDTSGNLLLTISNNVDGPVGLAFDSTGNLYVANSNTNSIDSFNSTSGNFLSSITSNVGFPFGVCFDSAGNMYSGNVADNTISKYNPAGVFQFKWSTGTGASIPSALAMQRAIVPEPSTWALGVIATGVMALIARRRKASKG